MPLPVRVNNLELDKEDLKKRLYPAYCDYTDFMIYKIRSTMQKIKAMERGSSANSNVRVDKLKTKVTELEKTIQDKNRLLNGNDDTVLNFIC